MVHTGLIVNQAFEICVLCALFIGFLRQCLELPAWQRCSACLGRGAQSVAVGRVHEALRPAGLYISSLLVRGCADLWRAVSDSHAVLDREAARVVVRPGLLPGRVPALAERRACVAHAAGAGLGRPRDGHADRGGARRVPDRDR